MSVISGIVSGVSGGAASGAATSAQSASSMQGIVYQDYVNRQNRKDLAPWREAGKNALATLVEKIASGPGDYTKSPGYDFRLKEGQRTIENSAAARGSVLSGATLKGLTKYGQEYASNDYDNFLRRYYESLNPLQSMAGLGQSSSAQTAALGASTGNSIANQFANIGNAQAAGAINSANSIAGGINSGVNNALAGYNAWRSMQSNGGNGVTANTFFTPTAGYGGYEGGDVGVDLGGGGMYGMQ